MTNSNILIVDDNPENVKVLGNTLREEEYNLLVAFNGLDALAILDTEPVDLILLDVMMPEIDGFELCERIKLQEDWQEIPVIFITALNDKNSVVKGLEVGGVDYITKPFNNKEVLARIHTHLSLRRTQQVLQDTLTSRDRLYAIIAHDLRSPLAAIRMMLNLLRDKGIHTPNFDLLITQLSDSTNQTYDLLENLLLWSKSQLGDIVPDKHVFRLEPFLNGLQRLFALSAQKKKLNLRLSVDPALQVRADRDMLKTVIRNLLSNAIKFTPNGGLITILADEQPEEVLITVSDTGIGISEESYVKIFDNKERITTFGTQDEKGSGLGLSLCFDFIEKQGGRLSVDSQEGKGSSFRIHLPV